MIERGEKEGREIVGRGGKEVDVEERVRKWGGRKERGMREARMTEGIDRELKMIKRQKGLGNLKGSGDDDELGKERKRRRCRR